MRVRFPSAAPQVLSLSSSRPRTLASQARDRGFKSHQGRHGVKLDWSTEGGLSSRYRPVRFRLAVAKFRASSLIGEAPGSEPGEQGSIPWGPTRLFPASSRVERTAVNRLIEVRVLGWEPVYGREMYGAWGAL